MFVEVGNDIVHDDAMDALSGYAGVGGTRLLRCSLLAEGKELGGE